MSITNNEITQNSKSEPKKFSILCTFKISFSALSLMYIYLISYVIFFPFSLSLPNLSCIYFSIYLFLFSLSLPYYPSPSLLLTLICLFATWIFCIFFAYSSVFFTLSRFLILLINVASTVNAFYASHKNQIISEHLKYCVKMIMRMYSPSGSCLLQTYFPR